MKKAKLTKRTLSLLLTLAMLLGMLPVTAAAAEQLVPQDSDYKGFSMENSDSGRWISYDQFSQKETTFYYPINLTEGNTWTKLTFTIELSQFVSLELYKLDSQYVTDNMTIFIDEDSGNFLYQTLPLDYKKESEVELEPEDPEDPDSPMKKITREDLLEDFLGQRMGYLQGVSITDHIYSTDPNTDDVVEADSINATDLRQSWDEIFDSAATAPKVTANSLYAFGFTGTKYYPPEPEEGEEVQAAYAMAMEEGIDLLGMDDPMSNTKVQNYFLWDGTVVGSNGTTNKLDEGYYVIVMTPEAEMLWQYNSFLAFLNADNGIPEYNADNGFYTSNIEAVNAATVDPVDLKTGSFTWDYTDLSLYGKHDLPFGRHYSSIDGDHNYGFGRGWTTDYTADVRLETFFAQVTLPGSQKLNFNINYDGSYQPDGDYTFAWNGNGYTLTNTYTKDIYRFDSDGKIQQLVHPDGNIINYSYIGDRVTGISNVSGSFELAYNAQGNVTSITDSEGRSITLTYDGHYLTSVENPDGDSLRYAYDSNGYLETVENFKGQVYVQNTYNEDGQVTHQYAADIGTFDFTYDRTNRHNTCVGTDGYLLEIRYDEKGRLTESTNAAGTKRFTWNDANQLTSETDRNGKTTRYDHDPAGNIRKITYPDGTTEQMTYNADRKVTGFVDRNGVSTTYTYDSIGNVLTATDGRGNTTTYGYTDGYLTSVTDALGNETTFTNDEVGNRLSMTDAKGNTTTYTYDGQGRLVSQTAPDGSVTEYEYTTAGKLVKITDAQGNEQTYTVDGNGFNTSASDWMGNLTAYERNVQNQITKVTDPLGNATTYSYDDRGNLVVTTDAKGNQTTYTYDASGRMISMTDAMGNTWTYAYDAEGRRTSATDPMGGKTTTVYDSVGRTSSVTDAKGGKTAYTYDSVGNTTAVKDALNQSARYTYDQNGNMLTRTDRNGDTWTYSYDANNRLTRETDPLGGETVYTYDELGQVTKVVTPAGAESSVQYDSMGRVTTATNALGHVTSYEYDSLGRRTKVTYADGTFVSCTYNANGQILTATDQLGGVTAYEYDANGRVISITDPMGGVTSQTYDAVGNVVKVTDALGNATTYTYNANNQIAAVTDAEGGVTGYAYDANGRVATVTDAEGGKTTYTYDAKGNVTKIVDAEGSTTTYTYDKLDRLTSVKDGRGNTTSYEYDAEGAITKVTDPTGKSASRSYDALGRLVSETDRNGNTRTYTYDADGRMTSATDPLGNTTTYTYDAMGNLLTQTAPLDRVNRYTYDEMGRRVTATDAMDHVVTFYYDDLGRITGYSNKDGSTVSYTYDANGNRLSVTDELGNVTRYAYDANNRLTSVTNALGHKTTYTYDKVGNLISTTDALGNVTAQTYDHLGNLTSQTDALGNTTAYAYDKLGRCVSITDPNGGVTAAQYDAAGNITKITAPEGNVTTYTYNARNELVSYTDAEGFTFRYTYDGNGNVLTYTDGNGNTTTYTYDGLNRATQRTDAAGNIATNEYDAAGRLIKAVNEEGAVTTYTYDADDRLLSMTDALGHVTSFEYDAMDRVTKVTDALGNATTYTYDALGRVATATNAKGVATTYTYDALGNRLTATDAAGTVSYAYDALGRCVSVTDRNGNSQAFAYDAKGQIVKVTDKNGNETKYTYDGNGNILKTTDAMGTEVLFQYNANDQLVKMTQNRVDGVHEQTEQLVTLYEYDGRNLVTKVVRADSQELYTYDGNGNMVSKTDGDGYVTEYIYNSLDLVSHINYNGTKEVSYQYDKVGNLVKMDDWLGTTTFEVDLLGQLTKMTDHKGNVVEYAYDAVGNQTSLTYPDETVVTKTYDEVYNLTKVHDAENKDYLYQYDDAGRVTKLTYPNGWVEDYTYDAEGNLLKTVDTDPFHNNKKATKYEYRYDAEGNLVSEYKRDTTAGNKALTTTYAYDALNRLVSAHEEGVGLNTTRTYEYDTLGNLIRQEEDGCIEYKYNGYALDESTKCGTIPNSIGTSYWEYTYDKRGNLISNDKYTRTTSGMAWQNEGAYVYDETNRMVQGKNEQGEYSLYTYNGLGIRVGRELIMTDNNHGYTDFHDLAPSVETGIDKPEVAVESYVIDYTSPTFNTLVMEEEGGFDYRWVYGLQRLSVKITSEGTNWWGQNVKEDILKDYLHQDRLGSTTNLTDQFGRMVGRADYNEWGEVTFKESLSISSSYRRIWPQLSYTGHDWDDVLGMYYAKARFYDADAKRFVAMDPIKGQSTDPLSLVSYLYCVDNPLRYVDPSGKYPTSLLDELFLTLKNNGFAEDVLKNIINTVLESLGGNSDLIYHQVAQLLTANDLAKMGYDQIYVEYTFPSGERADIIFRDPKVNTYGVLEIKPERNLGNTPIRNLLKRSHIDARTQLNGYLEQLACEKGEGVKVYKSSEEIGSVFGTVPYRIHTIAQTPKYRKDMILHDHGDGTIGYLVVDYSNDGREERVHELSKKNQAALDNYNNYMNVSKPYFLNEGAYALTAREPFSWEDGDYVLSTGELRRINERVLEMQEQQRIQLIRGGTQIVVGLSVVAAIAVLGVVVADMAGVAGTWGVVEASNHVGAAPGISTGAGSLVNQIGNIGGQSVGIPNSTVPNTSPLVSIQYAAQVSLAGSAKVVTTAVLSSASLYAYQNSQIGRDGITTASPEKVQVTNSGTFGILKDTNGNYYMAEKSK